MPYIHLLHKKNQENVSLASRGEFFQCTLTYTQSIKHLSLTRFQPKQIWSERRLQNSHQCRHESAIYDNEVPSWGGSLRGEERDAKKGIKKKEGEVRERSDMKWNSLAALRKKISSVDGCWVAKRVKKKVQNLKNFISLLHPPPFFLLPCTGMSFSVLL